MMAICVKLNAFKILYVIRYFIFYLLREGIGNGFVDRNFLHYDFLNIKHLCCLGFKVKASVVNHVSFNCSVGSCNANMDEIYIF